MENNTNNNNNVNEELSFNICDEDFILGKGINLESNDKQPKKEKRKKKKKGETALKNVIWISCTVIVSVALAFGCIMAGADYLGISFKESSDIEVQIAPGSTLDDIAQVLKDKGIIKLPWLFKWYSKTKEYDAKYQDGLYIISSEAGYSQIADELVSKGYEAKVATVTIPEGTGINDYTHYIEVEENGQKVKKPIVIKGIITILEENGICKRADFINALKEEKLDSKLLKNCDDERTYYALEGYLFPDTYEFYAYNSEECARMVIRKMIDNAERKITTDMYKRAEELGYSMNEVLTMASIIQMEAGTRTDAMPGVAAVFYNRLKDTSGQFNTLGSSPTAYYGVSFGSRDDGRYNTNNVEGLPPGPLCSPGIDAINAALYPVQSDYYYFVTDSDGNFYFTETLKEHNQKIAELKEQGKWVYEVY